MALRHARLLQASASAAAARQLIACLSAQLFNRRDELRNLDWETDESRLQNGDLDLLVRGVSVVRRGETLSAGAAEASAIGRFV